MRDTREAGTDRQGHLFFGLLTCGMFTLGVLAFFSFPISYLLQVLHTISIFLTVALAVWRYIMVALPMINRTLCTMTRAKCAISSSYLFPLILCIPLYLTFSIEQVKSKEPETNGTYIVNYSELAKANNKLLMKINFWIFR